MNGIDLTHAYVKHCQAAHDELHRLLRQVRGSAAALCLEHPPKGPAAAEQLAILEKYLTDHFALEEEGGYMEEALSRAPRFSAVAAELEREHPALLAEVRRLANEAASVNAPEAPQFAAKVEEVCAALARHEALEARILEAAFNRDLFAGD